MTTMRAVVADKVGEPSEVLSLQTCPIPEPGPGQVRIRVVAAPVEASDLHTVRGRYGFTPEFPTVPGIESVGVIDELGGGAAGMSTSTAAQILSNPLTAVILTSDVLDVRPGEWLLQTAAGSIR